MAKDDDLFTVDTRSFEKSLTKIERQVLPQAQAGFLSGLAFGARRALLAYADKNIQGKPNPWTRKGFDVDKATPDNLEAAVSIREEQAKYMTYLINGGVRRKGDPGASAYNVRVDSDEDSKNSFGNTRNGYLKQVARKARAEKTKRAKLRAKRDKLRLAGKSTAPARWANNSPAGEGGVFFGVINGKKGYWGRPTTDRFWRRIKSFQKPKMLIRFTDTAAYEPTFRWDDTIADSIKTADVQKMYSAEITRALKKLNDG